MSDTTQLIAQIRFALEQLSERNAQHEWEHLCRHLARERICSNILPATGPVQAGGDQGRDFETFRTFLSRSPLGGRSFVGLISDKPLAFACTLEKTAVPKIRSDVKTIMSSGAPVEGIYVFCSRDVPVAKRHELQEWARTTYGVELEIFDGAGVSEILGNRDLFWLAERYLQIPSELIPPAPEDKEKSDWYTSKLEAWRGATRPPRTFAEFSEIRAAARTAMGPFSYDSDGQPVNRHERPELPFWIELLDELANQDTLFSLRRRALYEASVLRLRGLGSLHGQEDRLRLYFAEIPRLEESSDLEDASVLLTYVLPATRRGHVLLDDTEMEAWSAALELRLDERLRETKKLEQINERCALLEVRGHAALFRRLGEGARNEDAALEYWGKLANLVNSAPLFPLERFADRLADYARFIGDHPRYDQLTEKIDSLLAQRFGQFKAAEKCLARAEAFRDAGDLPRAMAQLHRAKIDWFAEETLDKSLLALDWLGLAYIEQGLFFAAKYYALTSAYLTTRATDLRLKRVIVRSLERASSCDYAMGSWHSFLEMAEACTIFYPHFVRDAEADFNDSNGVLHKLMFHLSLLGAATKILHPGLDAYARDRSEAVVVRVGFSEVLEEVRDNVTRLWEGEGAESLWKTIKSQLAGPPWDDAGKVRHARWKAHGVTWNVEWPNDYESTLASEGFLAALQILLSDLAGYDLCLMRSTLNVSLRLAPDGAGESRTGRRGFKGFDTRFEPSNAERIAIVTLPPERHFRDGTLTIDDLLAGALGVAASLLQEVSLLPNERFNEVLNERFKQGLSNKLLIGATYGQCLREFVSRETFDASDRQSHEALDSSVQFVSELPDAHPWVDGPGPGYDPDVAREQMQNRYRGFAGPIARTLKRLAAEPEFQTTVENLRSARWKDWHILSAVYHRTVNYRINNRRIKLSRREEDEYIRRVTQEPEPENALPIPLEEYQEEKLREHFPVYLGSFATTFGLEIHQLTPDFPAIEDFLAQRYNFWADDVEHDDPFTS
ncbi:MAG: hypothetical protein LC803_21160 [Acidobacteria bacterium]|nr:hypothetical protein [Acidobacteriota bacterium]